MDKLCPKCGVTKPENHFYTRRGKPSSYCKPCTLAYVSGRYVRHPRIPPPEGFKRCYHCKETKPLAEFGANQREKDGHAHNCKTCNVKIQTEYRKRNPGKHNEYNKAWSKRHRESKGDTHLKTRYGLARGTYAKMFEEQGGRCKICGSVEPRYRSRRFHVDHCHDTLKVRGLLCGDCNFGLGKFKHDPTILQAAIQYLSN